MSKVQFRTNTLLKDLVGRDLINDDNIAVIELVKNAYDARSRSVEIHFEAFANGVTTIDSRLLIVDIGVGMEESDIRDKWLNIAYSEKKKQKPNPGQHFAGNKGVGRFSCDRLGARLDLITRKAGGPINHLAVNWPDFERENEQNTTIQSINMNLSEITPARAEAITGRSMPRHGTVLLISRLRSEWTRLRLLALKRTLEKFLNPNAAFESKPFAISISAVDLSDSDKDRDYLERINGPVKNTIFSNLEFKSTYIDVVISPAGDTVTTTLVHEGEQVFRLKEKNGPPLKDIHAVIYYLNPYKKAYFKRQTGVRSIEFGSVFLFLNGFRVPPYGDRGNDWLGIDLRRGQGHARYLGSRDLVGRIEVDDDEELFKPISSREGLKNTQAFVELRETLAMGAVRRLEKFVVDGLGWDSIPDKLRDRVRGEEGLDWKKTPEEYAESWEKKEQRIVLSMMDYVGSNPDDLISFWFNPRLLESVYERRAEEVTKLLADVDGFDESKVEPGLKGGLARLRRLIKDREREVAAAKSEVTTLRSTVVRQSARMGKLQRETETFKRQALFLQSVSSLDETQLLSFHHEISLNANIVENYLGRCFKVIRDGGTVHELEPFLEKIGLANKKVTAIAQFATKANFKAGTQKELTDVPAFVEQYIENVAKEFVGSGLTISVANTVDKAFELKLRRIELSILIDNIISNAGKAQAHSLKVRMELVGKNVLRLSFQDDGRGLSDAIKRPGDIFSLGVTTTSGSGLGLYHVSQIVKAMDGTVEAFPARPKGLEIRIEVTR